jgi:hypothetical protein
MTTERLLLDIAVGVSLIAAVIAFAAAVTLLAAVVFNFWRTR